MGERKERDALFDNVRAILIFLVVFGHLTADRLGEAGWMRALYYAIYMFHMPAFVFITGYFSKNTEKAREGAVRNYLVPYLIFNTLFALLNYLFSGRLAEFPHIYNVTKPQWGMWFFLACFFWRLLAKDLSRIRYVVPVAALLGLILPVFPGFGKTFTIGRLAGFLVFFVAGLKCPAEWIRKLRQIPRWIAGAAFAACAGISAWLAVSGWMVKDILYLNVPYDAGEKLEQMGMRAVLYLLGAVMTAALLVLVTGRKCVLTSIGQNTVTVYLLHLFLVHAIKKLHILQGEPALYLPVALLLAAALTWLLSRGWLRRLYDRGLGLVNKILFREG